MKQLKKTNRGVAYILALVLLAIFSTLALAFSASTDLNLRKSENSRQAVEARLAAESGLAFHAYLLSTTEISDDSTGQAILNSLATSLTSQLSGSANLQEQSIGYDGSTIVIPAVDLDDGKSFSAEITIVTGKVLRLSVVGQIPTADGVMERSVSIEVEPAGAFGYGMFAKGPITIGNGLSFTGANPAEASMASATGGIAITVDGGHIDGDVITCQPDATVDIGDTTVGGRIYCAESLPVPEIDGSIFKPFAKTTMSDSNPASETYTNIFIPANTNPTFDNEVTIRGVMYIEAPNQIEFKNNVNITGVIVSEEPGSDDSDSYIYFNNNLSVSGLDELPSGGDDEEEAVFATLRTMAGSAFLLPGFTLEFKNNFTSVSGTIAAEQIICKNNLDGTVYGSIVALGDTGLTFNNNTKIKIDRSKYLGLAPGFVPVGPKKLAIRPSSYTEN